MRSLRRVFVTSAVIFLLLGSIAYFFRIQIATSVVTTKLLGFGWSVKTVELKQLSRSDVEIRKLVLSKTIDNVETELELQDGTVHFSYPDTVSGSFSGRVLIKKKEFGKLIIDLIEVTATKPLNFNYNFKQVKLNNLEASVTASLSGVRVGEQELTVDPIALVFNQKDADTPLYIKASTPKLHAAVEFSNLQTSGQLSLPLSGKALTMNINEVHATAFGGQLSARNVNFVAGRLPLVFTLELKNIALAEIAALYKQERLSLEGQIDGELPVSIAREGISVADGSVTALPPGGVIRFVSPQSEPSTNEQLELARKAFENYHFTDLSAKVGYQVSGDMNLQVHSIGTNPDLPHGRSIELNINLEENIPALLRSIRLASGKF